MKVSHILIVTFIAALLNSAFPCTTAIVSGKYTPDGRPLLWKHRDTGFTDNRMVYFTDGKWDYIGLVNSVDPANSEVWAGCNLEGFAIMNSASYNLKPDDDDTKLKDREGIIMKLALMNCRTLEDFENMLDTLPKPLGIEANFGVIDAYGGAAYYECNNFEWKKIDANDPAVAPFGYLIRTNYSFTGSADDGYGYIRYMNAENLFYNAAAQNGLTPEFLLQQCSRSLSHSLTGRDLVKEYSSASERQAFVHFEDFIPRSSSVATVVVQGVKPGESGKNAAIWTILGWQLTSIAVPVFVAAGDNMPEILTADENGNAPLCDIALELKDRCYPIKRGSGMRYMNITALINGSGKGIMQLIKPVEDKILKETKAKLKEWRENDMPQHEIVDYYKRLNETVLTAMNGLL